MKCVVIILACSILCLSVGCHGKSSSFKKAEHSGVLQCTDMIIVRPEFTNEALSGSFAQEELQEHSEHIANAFASQFEKSNVLPPDMRGAISKCESQVIVVKLQSYSKKADFFGRYRGTITILAHVFEKPSDANPYIMKEFSATGSRQWGDKIPLESSIIAVSRQIRKEFDNSTQFSKTIRESYRKVRRSPLDLPIYVIERTIDNALTRPLEKALEKTIPRVR